MRRSLLPLALAALAPLCAQTQPPATPPPQPPEAWRVFEQARKLEKKGKVVDAYLLYSQASALDPANPRYRVFAQAVQPKAVMEGKLGLAAAAPTPAAADDLSDDTAELRIPDADLAEARKPQPPRELKGAPGLKSFNLKDNAKNLFQKVATAYGLDVVFDGEYQGEKILAFHVEDMDYRTALHALEAATGSFAVPVGDRLMLVAKDSPQKRQEVEPTVAIVLSVPNTVAIQEAQELVRNVQQTFDIQKMMLDSARRLLLVRDRVSKVYPAQQVLEQMLVFTGQVKLEVEFLAVNTSSTLNYGVKLQSMFSLTPVSGPDISGINAVASWVRFLAGKTFFSLGIADAGVFATMTRSTATTLLTTNVTSLDGKAATVHVGDKFPIITSGYYGTASNTGGNEYTPPPTVNFEDLGVVLKMTPFVHNDGDVTLEVEAEYKVLTGAVQNGIPVISSRKFQSRVRLKEGQWGVMAGLVNQNRSNSFNGIAGVSTLPLLGPFLRENHRENSSGEVLLVIKPTILGLPPGESGVKPIWVGSETRPLTHL